MNFHCETYFFFSIKRWQSIRHIVPLGWIRVRSLCLCLCPKIALLATCSRICSPIFYFSVRLFLFRHFRHNEIPIFRLFSLENCIFVFPRCRSIFVYLSFVIHIYINQMMFSFFCTFKFVHNKGNDG